ncbi:conjugal transfer protein MobC [Zhouia sp. PK063]|uniref:conjugal transfer protein MobC n=1 Tax=Zhouia sp. PK063 TaxID=3373602 RepID=UPI003796102B
MQTGENEQAMRKILDMTRLISILFLGIHFYYYCYRGFVKWNLTMNFTDRVLTNIAATGIFRDFYWTKLLALGFLLMALLGVKGRKDEGQRITPALGYMGLGVLVFFSSGFIFRLKASTEVLAMLYMIVTTLGYLGVLTGGTLLSRIIQSHWNRDDIFNLENETFPQEERLLENAYSVNLPARYRLKAKLRSSWINIINPFRGLLVLGTPGSGKSYFVIQHVIKQHIAKGFAMFIYDFKYDDLSKIAYNAYLKHRGAYAVVPEFYVINFDQIMHRCNPLEPSTMLDITDAAESARTILMGLNREWIKKQGDFFVESPINFLTAIIWYLRKYQDGAFCTLPHVIELMQADYDDLFTLLRMEPEIEVLINPFVNAYINDVMEQLEGQIASAKIAMARLSSPSLYYVMSGNDFTLDINDPKAPKIVCMGNNPQKIQTYGAVLSLYITRLIKQVNQKGKLKASLVFDEFPTIYLNHMDSLIATARSNKVATCLGIQDFSQLRKDYGKEQADVLINIVGNIISGQVAGDTAKGLSERFGKIMQDRESISINSGDTSISKNKQLDLAVPASTIAGLSSGAFVGVVADDPQEKIQLKAFHAEIINDHKALLEEEQGYQEIGQQDLRSEQIQQNYKAIKEDVRSIIETEIQRLLQHPATAHLVLKK